MAVETTLLEADGMQFTADVGLGLDEIEPKELVVFLHGFPHSKYSWRAEVPALDALGYRVVAFDQRGYSPGARPSGIEAYRTEWLIEDVLSVAAAVAAKRPGVSDPKFHLVGHDWGGQLGWMTAARHPERLHSLSIISRPHPASFIKSISADPKQAERSKHHRSFQRPEATDEMLADDAARLRKALATMGAGPDAIAAYMDVLGSHSALDSAINWYRSMGDSTLQPKDVPPTAVPTLYVWGNADASVGRVAAEGTGDLVEAPYTFVEVPDGSHCITDEMPGVFTELLVKHLESHPF